MCVNFTELRQIVCKLYKLSTNFLTVFIKCVVRWSENSVILEKFYGNWLPDGPNSERFYGMYGAGLAIQGLSSPSVFRMKLSHQGLISMTLLAHLILKGRGSSIGSEFPWHASGPEFDPHVRHIIS